MVGNTIASLCVLSWLQVSFQASKTPSHEDIENAPLFPDLGCHAQITDPIYLQYISNWCKTNYQIATLQCYKGCMMERLGILLLHQEDDEDAFRFPSSDKYEYSVMIYKLYLSLGEDETTTNKWVAYMYEHCRDIVQRHQSVDELDCSKWGRFFDCVQEGIFLQKCR